MFIINLTYIKSTEEVDQVLPAHIAYLDEHYAQNIFICSGRKNPRTGGIILCNAADKETVSSIISKDPFHIHQIADYEIIEFQPTKYSTAFSACITM